MQNEVGTRNANYATIVRNLRFTPHSWYEPAAWPAGLDRRHEQKHAKGPESSEFSGAQLGMEQMALQQQVLPPVFCMPQHPGPLNDCAWAHPDPSPRLKHI